MPEVCVSGVKRTLSPCDSGRYRGVCRVEEGWIATLRDARTDVCAVSPVFHNESGAARAYDIMATELFGEESAVLNFVNGQINHQAKLVSQDWHGAPELTHEFAARLTSLIPPPPPTPHTSHKENNGRERKRRGCVALLGGMAATGVSGSGHLVSRRITRATAEKFPEERLLVLDLKFHPEDQDTDGYDSEASVEAAFQELMDYAEKQPKPRPVLPGFVGPSRLHGMGKKRRNLPSQLAEKLRRQKAAETASSGTSSGANSPCVTSQRPSSTNSSRQTSPRHTPVCNGATHTSHTPVCDESRAHTPTTHTPVCESVSVKGRHTTVCDDSRAYSPKPHTSVCESVSVKGRRTPVCKGEGLTVSVRMEEIEPPKLHLQHASSSSSTTPAHTHTYTPTHTHTPTHAQMQTYGHSMKQMHVHTPTRAHMGVYMMPATFAGLPRTPQRPSRPFTPFECLQRALLQLLPRYKGRLDEVHYRQACSRIEARTLGVEGFVLAAGQVLDLSMDSGKTYCMEALIVTFREGQWKNVEEQGMLLDPKVNQAMARQAPRYMGTQDELKYEHAVALSSKGDPMVDGYVIGLRQLLGTEGKGGATFTDTFVEAVREGWLGCA